MKRYQHNIFEIEVYNDQTFTIGSADNNNNYEKIFFANNEIQHPTSKHGIKILDADEVIAKCLIVGAVGVTTIHPNSSLIHENRLIVCCSNSVFCLSIPNLEVEWITVTDEITFFQIFEKEDEFIVHGEMEVTKLSKNGQVKWKFGGKDIFVSMENQEEFKIEKDGILLCDFANTFYKIDFNGNQIWSENKIKKSR